MHISKDICVYRLYDTREWCDRFLVLQVRNDHRDHREDLVPCKQSFAITPSLQRLCINVSLLLLLLLAFLLLDGLVSCKGSSGHVLYIWFLNDVVLVIPNITCKDLYLQEFIKTCLMLNTARLAWKVEKVSLLYLRQNFINEEKRNFFHLM